MPGLVCPCQPRRSPRPARCFMPLPLPLRSCDTPSFLACWQVRAVQRRRHLHLLVRQLPAGRAQVRRAALHDLQQHLPRVRLVRSCVLHEGRSRLDASEQCRRSMPYSTATTEDWRTSNVSRSVPPTPCCHPFGVERQAEAGRQCQGTIHGMAVAGWRQGRGEQHTVCMLLPAGSMPTASAATRSARHRRALPPRTRPGRVHRPADVGACGGTPTPATASPGFPSAPSSPAATMPSPSPAAGPSPGASPALAQDDVRATMPRPAPPPAPPRLPAFPQPPGYGTLPGAGNGAGEPCCISKCICAQVAGGWAGRGETGSSAWGG